MAANVTFTATLPNGEVATRSTKTMNYVAVLAVADPGQDNWGAWSWHLTEAAAFDAAKGSRVRGFNTKVLPVEITKVVGKTVPGTELDAIKTRLAAEAKAAKADAKAAEAEAEAGITAAPVPTEADLDAASDVVAEMLAPSVEEATELLDAVGAAVTEALAEAKADKLAAATMSREQKQVLGSIVHRLAMQALDELPEGIDAAEATAVVEKWLSYIPRVKG